MAKNSETAWALLVVSDAGQADTLPDQEAWAHEVALERKWTITRVFSGVSSGKNGARQLTLDLLSQLEALSPLQRPARLLMIRLERLGRGDGVEAMETFIRLRRLGIVVHTRLDGDVNYSRASELLMPMLRFMIGGMENEVRRDKLLSMYARLRTAHEEDPTIAVSMKAPYGLRYEDGHYVPQAPEDAAVKLAFEMKAQGYGTHLIAKKLAVVAPPMKMRSGELRPQHWRADRVRILIINEHYRGTIVDDDLWRRAQRHAREIRRSTIRYEYSLGGALRCECGTALTGCKGTGKKSSTFRYYRCDNYELHGHMKHHRSTSLEEQFIALLSRLAVDDALLERHLRAQNESTDLDLLRNRLTASRTEYGRLEERRRAIFSAFEDGSLAQADLQWRLDDLRLREAELERVVTTLESTCAAATTSRIRVDDAKTLVKSASKLWPAAAVDDRRALAKAVANAFGGLIVTLDGTLTVEDRERRQETVDGG